ncbi:conserved hypothetical protein [Theileria orientalis strain Shintoku]|uniref:RAP domain-containing protein n=1 Tax=Theileria orientalis strain Shintoku TaxID=869250 RepID=J4DAT4_THEOR|nr:conserved hypothetical protein [Theileria orientalis strain Shintoku]BAM42175.1 conserved hypothetical protein [Theileria orientalis strain Shintoku]|eukprot:XP_009692476.1 conserved hypothetical protein [Theileria orientalis strain Shintoku]
MARILPRRRFYSSLEVVESGIGGIEKNGVLRKGAEQLQNPDRRTRRLESEFRQESLDFSSKLYLCERVSEVCELFSENATKLSANQLLLTLSRIIQINSISVRSKSIDYDEDIEPPEDFKVDAIDKGHDYFPANEFCPVPLNRLKCVNVKRLDTRVVEIFMKLMSKMAEMDREKILYLNRMCRYISGYHRKLVLSSSEDLLGAYVSQMDAKDMVRTAIAVASESENVEFVKIYIAELFKNIDSLNKEQKMIIFETMSKAKKCSTVFLVRFAEYINDCASAERGCGIDEVDSSDVASSRVDSDQKFGEGEYIQFLSVYSKNQKSMPRHLFKHLLARCLVVDFNKLSLSNVLDLVWISNKCGSVDLVLPKVTGLLTKKIAEIGPESLTMLIWSYSSGKMENRGFHEVLEQAAIDVSQELTPKNIALCAYSLSLKRADGCESRFHNHIQGDIVANISHFNGLDLAMLAFAYSSALCGSNVLHQCIQEAALNYVEELPADCISKLLVSYARIPGKTSLFSAFMMSFLQRMHQFPVHEFIQVMWAYLVMKCYERAFWTTCIEVVSNNFEQVINDQRCYLLYPVLKIITQITIISSASSIFATVTNSFAVNLVPLTSDLTRLINHTKKYFWASQLKNKNSELVSQVVKLVEGAENVKCDLDVDSFLVDVAFSLNGTNCTLLIYNDTNTFNRAPIGDLRLKELYLSNKGCKILRVLEDFWVNLDTPSQVAIISSQIKQ